MIVRTIKEKVSLSGLSSLVYNHTRYFLCWKLTDKSYGIGKYHCYSIRRHYLPKCTGVLVLHLHVAEKWTVKIKIESENKIELLKF